jgi:xyloglucan:xyloglucosyl transferase
MASSSAALAVLMLSWAAALAAASSPVTLFEAGYMPLFGGGNLVPSPGGRSVRLKLDRHTGKTYRRNNPLQLPT